MMLVSDFFSKELNSLEFYQNLDTQLIKDDLAWIKLKAFDEENLFTIETIDFLTYLLLVGLVETPLQGKINLPTLAKRYSEKYFELIALESKNLELKLKCQRLNYLIQIFLDKEVTRYQSVSTNDKSYFYPWDIEVIDSRVIVVESKDVVRYNDEVVGTLSNAGHMFTQVDRFDEHWVFNSCYSSSVAIGNFDFKEYVVKTYNNTLFTFYYKDKLSFLTAGGDVKVGDSIIGNVEETNQPWRFRVVNDNLFIFDWLKLGSCIIFNLNTGLAKRLYFDEMWIPHDVVRVDNCYYFLDKQQGKVFIYDLNLKFLRTVLSFGYNEGQLCDPIGIKKVDNTIAISSWLSGKINFINK